MKKILSLIFALTLVLSLVFTLPSFAADDEVAKDGWSITASSEIIPVKNAIDNDINTYWHSSYKADGSTITGQDRPPFIIELTLPEVTEISGLRYYPRIGGAVSGTFYDVMIYASENGTDYEEVGEVKFQYNGAYSDREGGKTVNFTGNIKVKSIKLNVLRAYTDFGTMAELSLLKSDSSLKTTSIKDVDLKEKVIIATLDGQPTEHIAVENASPKASALGAGASAGDEKEEVKKEHDDEVTDMEFWVAEASSGAGSAKYVVDGSIDSIWHSSYKAEGSTITEIDPYPHVLTLTLPYTLDVSGFRYYPRLGGAVAGTILEAGVEISADGENFTSLGNVKYTYNGAYTDREGGRATKFDSNVKIKALRLTVTKGHGGFSTCAELHLLKSDEALKVAEVTSVKIAEEKKEEKPATGGTTPAAPATPATSPDVKYEVDEYAPEGFVADASSSIIKPQSAIDGKMDTYWHTNYKVEGGAIVSHDVNPFDFVITFPEETVISGLRYYPRQKPQPTSGVFYIVSASVSDDGENFTEIVKDYTMYYGKASGAGDRTPCEVSFNNNIKAKAVKITITHSDGNYGVASEIRVLKPVERLKNVTVAEIAANPGDYLLLPIDRSEVKVTTSSYNPFYNLFPEKLIDDNIYSIWHTQYTDENGKFVTLPEKVMPALIEFDLGKAYEISALGYMPRGDGFMSGHWVEFEVWYSEDGNNFEKIDTFLFNDTQAKSYNYHMLAFPEAVKARYFQIEVFRTLNDSGEIQSAHASAGDVSFFETENVQNARLSLEKEKYELKIGSNEIAIYKGEEKTVKEIDVAPFIVDGTTMIPLRGLFEEMGATVSWNGDEEKIGVQSGDTELLFQIENTRVFVNGVRYGVIVAPRIVNSRTFIPLRFVSENLGYTVSWDGATQTITIEK